MNCYVMRCVCGLSMAGLCLQLVWDHSLVCLRSVRKTKEGTRQHVQRSYFARHTLIQFKYKRWHTVSLRDSYALTIKLTKVTNKFTVTLFRHLCIGVQLRFLSGVWAARLRPVFGPTSTPSGVSLRLSGSPTLRPRVYTAATREVLFSLRVNWIEKVSVA